MLQFEQKTIIIKKIKQNPKIDDQMAANNKQVTEGMVPRSSEESPTVTREVVSIPTLPQQVDDKAVARKMRQIDKLILKLKTATPSRGDEVPPAQAPAVVAAEPLEVPTSPTAEAAASASETVALTWTVPTEETATTVVMSPTDGLGIIRPINNEVLDNSELGHMLKASLSLFTNKDSETEEPPDEDE